MLTPGQNVTIDYIADGGTSTRRTIDVLAVYSNYGHTYVRGFCHLRREERTFRMDRMRVVMSGVEGRRSKTTRQPAAPQTPFVRAEADRVVPLRMAVPTTEKSLHRRFFRKILVRMYLLPGFGLYVLFGGVMEENPGTARPDTGTVTVVRPEPSPQKAIPVPPRTSPVSRPESVPQRQSTQPSPIPPPAVDTRAVVFTNHSGIDDSVLLSIYRRADRDGDGRLSRSELEYFQGWVYRSFRYEENGAALAPDRFGAVGGGDCEDFALYTCGLLAYWGYECYVGGFSPVGKPFGRGSHGVALLVVHDAGPQDVTIKLNDASSIPPAARGKTVIPIDYDVVGGFTNATPDPWMLVAVYEPTEIYGSNM